MKEKIYLCGFMGCGKSMVGERLAKKINRLFIDTDAVIESESQKTITEIFNLFGETAFRRLESDVVRRFSVQKKYCVIALGGGSLIDPANLRLVQSSGYLIYLKTDLSLLLHRLKNTRNRPLLRTETAEDLFRQREQGYLQAHWVCDCANFDVPKVTELIVKHLLTIS